MSNNPGYTKNDIPDLNIISDKGLSWADGAEYVRKTILINRDMIEDGGRMNITITGDCLREYKVTIRKLEK